MTSGTEANEETPWVVPSGDTSETEKHENTEIPIISEGQEPDVVLDQLYATATDRHELFREVLRYAVIVAKKRKALFIFGGQLVEMVGGQPIAIAKAAEFRSWATEHLPSFLKWDEDQGVVGGQFCPLDIATLATSRLQPWKGQLQEIESITGVPFFLPDGSAVTKVGYYPELKLFNVADSGLEVEDLRGRTVTQEEAWNSLEWLLTELFGDFPFVSPADRANAAGLPLALLTQHIHGEALPLAGITGFEAGTGKTELALVFEAVGSATKFGTTELPTNEGELSKVVISILRSPQPVVIWDNAQRGSRISSRTLCQLHTSATYTGRTLGVSEMGVYRNNRLWVVTANAMLPAGDMIRRYIQIALDAGMKDPALAGRKFRHPDLIEFIQKHRADVLRHYYIVFKAWMDAGQPPAAHGPSIGSYQRMIDIVAGALEHAGLAGFWTNMDAVRDDAVEGSQDQAAYDFLRWIATSSDLNPEDFTSRDVVAAFDKVVGSGFVAFEDRSIPLPDELVQAWRNGTNRATSTGRFFSSIKGQRFSDGEQTYRIETHAYKPQNQTHFKIILEITGDLGDLEDQEA